MSNDPDRPIKLASFAGEAEATIISNALKAFGIKATTLGGFLSGFKAEAPSDVVIMVPQHQLEKAQVALQQIREDMNDDDAEVDWSQVDVGEPE